MFLGGELYRREVQDNITHVSLPKTKNGTSGDRLFLHHARHVAMTSSGEPIEPLLPLVALTTTGDRKDRIPHGFIKRNDH